MINLVGSNIQYGVLKTISAQDCYNDISLVITPTEYAETVWNLKKRAVKIY